jgi:hypothetical protein
MQLAEMVVIHLSKLVLDDYYYTPLESLSNISNEYLPISYSHCSIWSDSPSEVLRQPRRETVSFMRPACVRCDPLQRPELRACGLSPSAVGSPTPSLLVFAYRFNTTVLLPGSYACSIMLAQSV